MDYNRKLLAVSSGDHKLAALFFDQIFPMHSYPQIPRSLTATVAHVFPSGDAEGPPDSPMQLMMVPPEDTMTYCRYIVKHGVEDRDWGVLEFAQSLIADTKLSEIGTVEISTNDRDVGKYF